MRARFNQEFFKFQEAFHFVVMNFECWMEHIFIHRFWCTVGRMVIIINLWMKRLFKDGDDDDGMFKPTLNLH